MLIQAIGATGIFASRIFLPAFAAALVIRFGPQWGLTGGLGLLQWIDPTIAAVPTWFTANETIIILGLLAAAEVLANKHPDARALLQAVDKYAKPAMAVLTYFGLLSVADEDFIKDVLPATAGWSWEAIFAPFIAAGTYVLAQARSTVLDRLTEADEDDEAGAQWLFSWAEDIWAVFGLWFLILFPVVMIVLIAIVNGLMLLLFARARYKEERAKVECANCGATMYRAAMACPSCGENNPAVSKLTWLGAAYGDEPADLNEHPYRLAALRRCPTCATRLPERKPVQECPRCDREVFGDKAFAEQFANRVSARLPVVLAACFGLGLLPVIGLIPGVILYRLTLVAPFRRYISWRRNFGLRWFVKILFFILVAVQWVPGVGGFALLAMALISHLTYRHTFQELLKRG